MVCARTAAAQDFTKNTVDASVELKAKWGGQSSLITLDKNGGLENGTATAEVGSAAPIAYATSSPLYLTDGNQTISDKGIYSMKRNGIAEFCIFGGTAAVSEQIEEALLEMQDI